MRATTLQLLAGFALALGAADAQSCALPTKTLTYECGSACAANVPCWYNTTTPAAVEACRFVCMSGVYDQYKTLSLIVPFGTWKSAAQQAEPVPLRDGTVNTLASYAYINNNYLETIDALDLPPTSAKVAISGGTSLGVNTKGHVSNVKLSPTLIANGSAVTIVWLLNLNLQPQVENIPQMLPPKIQYLALDNGLFTELPKGLGAFPSLKALFFRTNYVKNVDSTAGLDGLTELWLSENNLESFTAVFPKLQTLDLALNDLDEIPEVLASYTSLQTLWYYNNSVTEVPKDAPLPSSLTTLHLYNNEISSFEKNLPSLTALDLSNNELTEIPPIVYTFPSLTLLKLQGNKMKNVSLTNAQAAFLSKLNNFTFDAASTFKDCFTYQQKAIQGVPFCISDVSLDDGDDDDEKKKSSSSIGLILGLSIGGVVVIAIIVFVVLRRRKNSKNGKEYTYQDGTMTNGTNGTGTTSLWYDSALLSVKVNAEDVEDIKAIGKGAFGDVWLVRYRKTQLLASKRLRKSEATRERTNNFIEEIKLVAKLEHPNIVAFVGAAWTIESDLQALFEYMDGGDLRDYLENANTPRAWSPEKVQIAIDVAEALVYVHSFNPPLVHRDLKSRNVLLSATDLQAKLTDFGVSRFRSEDNTMTSGVGTGKWLAPEVIAGSTDYGSAADIFSYGAVLVELDTHKLPYDEVRGANGAKVADVALLQMIASGQVRPTFTASCPEKIAEIGNRCFALNPSERPAAAEIAYALRQLKKSMYRA